MDWLVLNPDRTLKECAQYFGYTPAWLSQIIHSDMFQALYRERSNAAGEIATHTIAAELGGLTHAVIAKSLEKIENNQASERFLGQVLDTTLDALGYGAKPTGNPGIINVQVNAQTILESQERAARLREGTTQAKVVELTAPSAPSNGTGHGHTALEREITED
ncbi:MAG TPA: hypothetical protein VLH56_19115 [Dissulfurispiraceae bacterium]|nr:hypothetical protein [Dissulfurispiraceae bacterium]